MKKHFLFLLIVFLLAVPFTASADLLGEGTLNVRWSTPIENTYFLDYDGQVTQTPDQSSDFGYTYTTGFDEIFCVSDDDASSIEQVSFYRITDDLNSLNTEFPDLYSKLSRSAWIADNWTNWLVDGADPDIIKAEAQKAVWEITGVMHIMGDVGIDTDIFKEANNHDRYATDNWVLAVSEGYASGVNQDYLVKMNPVPEPATMLLLGSGLIGLAGFGRKRFMK